MGDVIGVRFRRAGKIYYFDPSGVELEAGDHVVVKTSRGQERSIFFKGFGKLNSFFCKTTEIIQKIEVIVRLEEKLVLVLSGNAYHHHADPR